MTVLLKITTSGKSQFIELSPKHLILGRSEHTSFKILDSEISSKHLEIWLNSGITCIKDLESTNGTYVNGSMQKSTNIYLGDEIKIGKTILTLDQTKMTEDEIDAHTLNVKRKQTEMINLGTVGFESNKPKIEKAVQHTPASIAKAKKEESEQTEVSKPWWKKIF